MKALPSSAFALYVLLGEVDSFLEHFGTLYQMFTRIAFLLNEILRRGDLEPDTTTARFLEHQRDALARHVADLRYPRDAFLEYLPDTVLPELGEVILAYSAASEQSGCNWKTLICSLSELNPRLSIALEPFRLLRRQIFDRLVADGAAAPVSGTVSPALVDRAPALTDRANPAASPGFGAATALTVRPNSHAASCSSPDVEVSEPEDTEGQVANILAQNPRAKSARIARRIGKSGQRVRSTAAWRSNRAALKDEKDRRSVRTRPLTRRMLAAIDSSAKRPADIAVERELDDRLSATIEGLDDTLPDAHADSPDRDVLERHYLEQADATEKAEYYRMIPEQRQYTVQAWMLTRMP